MVHIEAALFFLRTSLQKHAYAGEHKTRFFQVLFFSKRQGVGWGIAESMAVNRFSEDNPNSFSSPKKIGKGNSECPFNRHRNDWYPRLFGKDGDPRLCRKECAGFRPRPFGEDDDRTPASEKRTVRAERIFPCLLGTRLFRGHRVRTAHAKQKPSIEPSLEKPHVAIELFFPRHE